MANVLFNKTEDIDEITEKMREMQEWFIEKEVPVLCVVGVKGVESYSETSIIRNFRHAMFTAHGAEEYFPDVFRIMHAIYTSEFLRLYAGEALKDKTFRDVVWQEMEDYNERCEIKTKKDKEDENGNSGNGDSD